MNQRAHLLHVDERVQRDPVAPEINARRNTNHKHCATQKRNTMTPAQSIFVQIPSYRDPQLVPTLVDMIENATEPCSLRIVVCWQHSAEEDIQTFTTHGFDLIQTINEGGNSIHILRRCGATAELIDVHYTRSKGCGWARNLAQQRYRDEPYNLQIDSHHRFSTGWDIKMKNLLEVLRLSATKPLITGHPPDFDPHTYPLGRQEYTSAIVFRSFSPVGLVKFKSVRINSKNQEEIAFKAKFIAGGFIFSDGKFIQEVLSDPGQFFSTEEIVISARAYTHGYEFFHPYTPLLWHQYDNDARKVWDDHTESLVASGHIDACASVRSDEALRKALSLFGLSPEDSTAELGEYGLGSERTLLQYERYAGISFSCRAVHQESLIPREPDKSFDTIEKCQWEQRLIYFRSMRVSIFLSNDCSTPPASLIISSHSADAASLSVRELSNLELDNLSNAGHIQYIEEVKAPWHRLPTQYALHTRSGDAVLDHQLSIVVEEVEM